MVPWEGPEHPRSGGRVLGCQLQTAPALHTHHHRQARAVGSAAWLPLALGGQAECRGWHQPSPFRAGAPVSPEGWASL